MLKVVKEDVEVFKELSDKKTPEETYVWGFDYNCEGLEEIKVLSEEGESDQKNQKLSAEEEDGESYKKVFKQEGLMSAKKIVQTLWNVIRLRYTYLKNSFFI